MFLDNSCHRPRTHFWIVTAIGNPLAGIVIQLERDVIAIKFGFQFGRPVPHYHHDLEAKLDGLDMGYFLIGVHVALVAAPGIIAGPFFGALSDRVGRRSVIAFLMLVAVVLSLTTALAGGGIGMTVSVALFGLFHSSVNSLTQAAAIDEAEGKGLDATFMGLMWGSNAQRQ